MSDPRHRLGRQCEEAAAGWLARSGWRIVARRQRSAGGGEVDLIAIDPADVLVAIEVRGRRTVRAGHALQSVDARHIRRVRRTLAAFAATTPWHRTGLRVDLVTVEPIPGRPGTWHLCRVAGIE